MATVKRTFLLNKMKVPMVNIEMSIRKKISFLFLLSVFITTIAAILCFFYVQKTVRQNIFDKLEVAADELREQVHDFLREKKTRTLDFSSDGFIRSCTEEIARKEERRKYYTTALNGHLIINKKSLDPGIIEIFVVDFKGNIIASTNKDRIGEDVSSEEYFIKAGLLSAFAGEPHFDTHSKEIIIDFSTILLSKVGQEAIGVIVNRIKSGQIEDGSYGGTVFLRTDKMNYSELAAVNKARIMDFSSDSFIRDCAEEIIWRDDRVQYYTDLLNTHLDLNKQPLDPDLLSIFVVDFTGKIIGSSEFGLLGRDMSNEEFFFKTMKYGSCVSDLHYYPDSEHSAFEVARLILSKEGKYPIGIIVNRYNGNSIIRITRSEVEDESGDEILVEGLGKTWEVYIVNGDKLMVTGSRYVKDAILKQVVDSEGVRAAFDSGVGMIGIYPDYRGVQVLGVSRYFEDMDWVVLAEKDV